VPAPNAEQALLQFVDVVEPRLVDLLPGDAPSLRLEHIRPELFYGIDFKLAVLTYRCLHGLAPQYLSDYTQSVAVSNRRRLRSSSSSQLVIRRTRLSTVGDRAFPVAVCRL